jgi:Flp pilus assembly protein TadD
MIVPARFGSRTDGRPAAVARAASGRPWSRLLPLCGLLLAGCAGNGGYGALRPPPDEPTANAAADDPRMYVALIEQMQRQGLYYASLAHIDACVKAYGDTAELQRLRADALRRTDSPAEAERLYRGLLQGSEAAAAWHGLGLLQAAQGNDAAAAAALAEAVSRSPIDATFLSDLGYARLRLGNIEGARASLSRAAQLAPNDARAISNLALLFDLQGQYQRADTLMREANLSADAREAIHRMAQTLGHKLNLPHTAGPADARSPDGNGGITAPLLQRFREAPPSHGEAPHESR